MFLFFSGLSAQQSAAIDRPFAVGGSFSFSSVNEQDVDDRSVNLEFYPSIAYQVSSHWQLGAALEFGRFTADYTSTITSFIYEPFPPFPGPSNPVILTDEFEVSEKWIDYGIGLFGRYSFNPQNQLRMIFQPRMSIAAGTFNSEREGRTNFSSRTLTYGLRIQPGVVYAASSRINLVALLGNFGFAQRLTKADDAAEYEKDRFESFARLTGSIFLGAELRF